jgi:hypothetical protein
MPELEKSRRPVPYKQKRHLLHRASRALWHLPLLTRFAPALSPSRVYPSMSRLPSTLHSPLRRQSVARDLLHLLKLARDPHSLAASLAALPSMSLIPFVPFAKTLQRYYAVKFEWQSRADSCVDSIEIGSARAASRSRPSHPAPGPCA